MPVDIDQVSWVQAGAALRAIRTEVFVLEQHVPEALEWDEFDAHAVHVLARVGSENVGTGRLLFEAAAARIGRMAVRKAWRRQGVGSAILQKLIAVARERGCQELRLYAQTHALQFYERVGFVAEGDIFTEAGIAHRSMLLRTSLSG